MMNEPNFGSSEYSEAAEELFAQYVTRREAGESIDFERYCADHAERADELYGLHADWDNVAGLLRRVEAKRPAAVPEPKTAPEPVPAVPTAPPPPRRESPRWKLLSGFGLLLTLAVGGFAVTLSRNNSVLARDKDSLTEEKQQLTTESAERERARLVLAGELETASEELATTREALAGERERRIAEQAGKEQAQLDARLATARADGLAAQLKVGALNREATALRPARPGMVAALEAWLARANELTATSEDHRAALEDARGRIEARLAMLERLRTEATEHRQLAWTRAIEAIADNERNPMYAGLELAPHFALVPLGPDPESGRWRFADLRTGTAPLRDEGGELSGGTELALCFQLIPGSTEGEDPVSPFLIAAFEPTPAHREYAGVIEEYEELGYSRPTPAQARLAGTDRGPVLPLATAE